MRVPIPPPGVTALLVRWRGGDTAAQRDQRIQLPAQVLTRQLPQLPTKQVFAWLNECFELHSIILYRIDGDTLLAPFHSDARFAELKRRMGISS